MKDEYEIVLYREEGVWVAEVPELPGCATHADTRAGALDRIQGLIQIGRAHV